MSFTRISIRFYAMISFLNYYYYYFPFICVLWLMVAMFWAKTNSLEHTEPEWNHLNDLISARNWTNCNTSSNELRCVFFFFLLLRCGRHLDLSITLHQCVYLKVRSKLKDIIEHYEIYFSLFNLFALQCSRLIHLMHIQWLQYP